MDPRKRGLDLDLLMPEEYIIVSVRIFWLWESVLGKECPTSMQESKPSRSNRECGILSRSRNANSAIDSAIDSALEASTVLPSLMLLCGPLCDCRDCDAFNVEQQGFLILETLFFSDTITTPLLLMSEIDPFHSPLLLSETTGYG